MPTLHHKISEGEHQQQDFKFAISDSRKIARSLSAFANTDGGRLLIGVKDNGNISGVRTDEEIYMIQAAAELYSTPIIDFSYQNHEVNGKQVLEILVHKSADRPHYVKEIDHKLVAYFRQKDENFPANNVLLKFWKLHKTEPKTIEIKEREVQLLTFLRNNPYITIKRYTQMAGLNLKKAEDLLAVFMRWGLIEWEFNGKFFTYKLPE